MRYFAAINAGDSASALALLSPDSFLRGKPLLGLNSVTRVRINKTLQFPPPKGFSAEPAITARVDASEPSGWGPVGRKYFYVTLREAPAGTWLIFSLSSGR